MSDIIIGGELAERLWQAAQTRKVEVEALLAEMLDRLGEGREASDATPAPNTLAAHLAAAREANLRFGNQEDVSERSREIIEQEWGQHLTRWMTEDNVGNE